MFSKPILIAASVASAQAALLTVPTSGSDSVVGTDRADKVGCGKCIAKYSNTPTWVYGGTTSLWTTVASTVANAVTSGSAATTLIAGGICCLSALTQEGASGTAVTYCGGAMHADGNALNTKYIYANTAYVPAALAHCPHDKTNCGAAAKKKDTTTAISLTDERFIELADQGSYVDLTLTVNATPGTEPALKQKEGDVCTWVIQATCDAPVLTATAGVATAAEYEFQITEWSEEFLVATAAAPDWVATWAASAQTGATSKLYYPPLTAAVNTAITDLQATATVQTVPNNMLAEVAFNENPTSAKYSFTMVPGQTLVEWITWLNSVYTSYKAEVVTYDKEAALWKTYAEYKAPEPGLFGPTEDADAPKGMSIPRQPTQPVDVPNKIKGLSVTATDYTASTGKYASVPRAAYGGKAKAGYGYPSAMMIVPVTGKTVRPWGTLAGGGQLAATATAQDAKDLLMSVRKTTNVGQTATGAGTAACNKSYLMITALKQATTAAATVTLKVTAQAFASTLAEQIPTRPGATTAPVAAPAGATQLAASAVAAALTALYLF